LRRCAHKTGGSHFGENRSIPPVGPNPYHCGAFAHIRPLPSDASSRDVPRQSSALGARPRAANGKRLPETTRHVIPLNRSGDRPIPEAIEAVLCLSVSAATGGLIQSVRTKPNDPMDTKHDRERSLERSHNAQIHLED
jgi:hypothetical protein